MANTLLTPTVIANELLLRFKNSLPFARNCEHPYDGKFDHIGDTYNLREPVRFTTVDGPDITSSISDVTETSTPITINKQKVVAIKFGSKDLTLTIDRFYERYCQSAILALANQFEVDGLTTAYQATANLVGTPATTPATAKVVLDAGVKLDDNACPMDGDRNLVVNPAAQAAMVDGLKALLNSGSAIGGQYVSGKMATALGFDWYMSQNIRRHTVGAWAGTPLVKGADQTGATLDIDGLTAATAALKKGDVFTIAGVYAVNPVSGDVSDQLQQFTVTADIAAVSNEVAKLPISPSIVTSGATKTVSASPADNAAITVVGTPGTAYPMNMAFHKKAFNYAMVPLIKPAGVDFAAAATDKDTGLSLRIVRQFNILTDDFVTRVDIMYGWAAPRPQWACRVIG